MALILAPYNDSMRLGMGFNSYSQTTCIDNAVEVKANSSTVHSNGTAQVNFTTQHFFKTKVNRVVGCDVLLSLGFNSK